MKSQIKNFSHESFQDCHSISDYLNAISEGFKSGSITFSNHRKKMIFKPEGLLNLEVHAIHSDLQSRIEIKINWRDNKSEENKNSLKIS